MNKIILTILAVFIYQNSFTQDNSVQKFFYQDDVVNVMIKVHGSELDRNDSLKMDIRIRNISCESIFVLYEGMESVGYINGSDGKINSVNIDIGYNYSSDIEFEDKIIEVLPGRGYEYKKVIGFDFLIKKDFVNPINLNCGLGYIKSIKTIKENLSLSGIKISGTVDGIYTLGSITIESSMVRAGYLDCGTFTISGMD